MEGSTVKKSLNKTVTIFILSYLLFCFIATTSLADEFEFIHVSCIPETRYFEVEYKSVPTDAVLIGTDYEKEGKQRLNAWKKRGYYEPSNFSYECKLPDSTYLITANQPPGRESGMCGASPSITLSLTRNGDKWLNNVVFGANCFGVPSIMRISIRDGQEGWDTRNADLCILPSNDIPEYCEYLSETYQDIGKVMPLTQEDLARYCEINWTTTTKKQNIETVVGPQKIGLAKFKDEICGFSDFNLPPDAVIYAAGGYGTECKMLGYQIDQSGVDARIANVLVNEPNRPVVLLLGAHEPTVWNIKWTTESKILAVAASGSYGDAIAGISKNIPVLLGWNYKAQKKVRACEPFYVKFPIQNENKDQINKLSKAIFGRPTDFIVHFDQNGNILIGETPPAGTKTQTSPDIPPASFFDPQAPLAGETGLIDAIKKGLLRKATTQDAELWRKGELIVGKQTINQSESKELWNSYVVLKPFKYPKGLGPTIFYVPKGVPLPEGDRRFTTLYDSNNMKCIGPMCKQ
jgi:hypothetical protein